MKWSKKTNDEIWAWERFSLLLPSSTHHHHHFLCCCCAAAAQRPTPSSKRSCSIAGARRHKRALDASSTNIDTKVIMMIEVWPTRHQSCYHQIWSQALTQLSYLILFEVGEKCFFVVNFTSSHDWDFTFNFKRLRQRWG
mgnify:CR=1 FL=1